MSLITVQKGGTPHFVIRMGKRLCKTVPDNHDGGTSQQGHLYVAHHSCGAVNILRHKQHMLLVIDAMLSGFPY